MYPIRGNLGRSKERGNDLILLMIDSLEIMDFRTGKGSFLFIIGWLYRDVEHFFSLQQGVAADVGTVALVEWMEILDD